MNFFFKGWPSGESTWLPPMWPRFEFRTRCHMWIEFVGSLVEIFIFIPEHFSKLFRVFMKISTEDAFARVAIISSAYRSVLISSLSINCYAFNMSI